MNPKSIDISKGLMSDFPKFAIPPGGLSVCKNLYPWEDVYAPVLNGIAYSSNSMAGTPLSGIEYVQNTGTYRHFFGTTTKLYRLETGRTFTDITRVSGAYTTEENQWKWSKYGEWVIATNFNDSIQILKGMTESNFIPLGGSPPKCKFMLMVHGHLILFYIDDGTVYPNRLIHSPKDDIENWTPGAVGYSKQDLPDASGPITGVANFGDVSDDGTNRSKFAIFHPDSITVCHYVGSPNYFNIEPNRIKNIGAIPNTMVSVGNMVYFWSEKDIYSFNGVYPESIGFGVRRTILDSINKAYYHRITTAVDLQRNIIFWSYPTTNSDGASDRIVAYNYNAKRFTIIDAISHELLMNFHKAELLMDDIDAIFPSMDDIPYDMDSNYWMDDAGILGVVDSTGVLNVLAGSAVTGTIETGEISDGANGMFLVSSIRPKVSNYTGVISGRVASRNNEDDVPEYSESADINEYGEIDIEQAGRYNSIELTTSNHMGISGIDIKGRTIAQY